VIAAARRPPPDVRAALAIALLAIAAAAGGGALSSCAVNRCEQAQVRCEYECARTYQLCRVNGGDENTCGAPYRACWDRCTAARIACGQ
jgi:hypothetical protein